MAVSEPDLGYEKCVFFDTFYDCGEHKKSRIFSVSALSVDVTNHLQNLGLHPPTVQFADREKAD